MWLSEVIFIVTLLLHLVTSMPGAHCPISEGVTVTNIQRLRNDIFCKYDRFSRPRSNPNTPINVTIRMDLQYIEINERADKLILSNWFMYNWDDEFLKWDPSQYDDMEKIQIPATNIWVPDIVVYNHERTQQLVAHTSCVLNATGQVVCTGPAGIG